MPPGPFFGAFSAGTQCDDSRRTPQPAQRPRSAPARADRQAQDIARQVAAVKRATGYPTRDYAREREILLDVRARAEALGLPGDLVESILRLLIRSSLTTQEQASVAAHGAGSGQRALVIGGAGKMGGWFVQFLMSQGFQVDVADPRGAPRGANRGGRLAQARAHARLHRGGGTARRHRCGCCASWRCGGHQAWCSISAR